MDCAEKNNLSAKLCKGLDENLVNKKPSQQHKNCRLGFNFALPHHLNTPGAEMASIIS